MATLLKSSNTIDFNRVRQHANPAASGGSRTTAITRLRYRLLAQLQTTLEIQALLRLFHDELVDELLVDGLRYINEQEKILETVGQTATHSCGYRLVSREDNLGELVFYRNTRFSEKELANVEYLLSCLLCPLRNALQYRQALAASMSDPLTGAGNRIALETILERELAIARRYRQPFSILVIDVDGFKHINDEHGHSAGDKALKSLVQTLSAIHRNTDMCFRFGGEEFVVVLNSTEQEGAETIAERIRLGVEAQRITYRGKQIRLSVSIGVSTWIRTDTRESLFNRADQALYDIKRSGGNQVKSL